MRAVEDGSFVARALNFVHSKFVRDLAEVGLCCVLTRSIVSKLPEEKTDFEALCPKLLGTCKLVNRDPDLDEIGTLDNQNKDPKGKFMKFSAETGKDGN